MDRDDLIKAAGSCSMQATGYATPTTDYDYDEAVFLTNRDNLDM